MRLGPGTSRPPPSKCARDNAVPVNGGPPAAEIRRHAGEGPGVPSEAQRSLRGRPYAMYACIRT